MVKVSQSKVGVFGWFLFSWMVLFSHQTWGVSQAKTSKVDTSLFRPLPLHAPDPAQGSSVSSSVALVSLGQKLFFEPRLSKDKTVSCNSCHNVMSSGSDGQPTSAGVGAQRGGRNSPTVWNAAFMGVQFWDGRAASLEAQSTGPLVNPLEMAMESTEAAMDRLRKIPGYVKEFEKVFGVQGAQKAITSEHWSQAVASYERTLITPHSKFDRYLSAKTDVARHKIFSSSEQRGLELVTSIGCTTCHQGVMLAGPALPQGIGFYQKFPTYSESRYIDQYKLIDDTGRHKHTGDDADRHMWRVPTWRNVALTAPYFHNGSVDTLDEAVRVMAKTQLNQDLKDKDVADIVAFLKTLNGEFPKQFMPRLPD